MAKKQPSTIFLAFAAGMAVASCSGPAASPPEAAATSSAEAGADAGGASVLRDLKADWQAQKDTMMKIAAAMPEDKFAYKSTPVQRSFGEQIMHVASANVELLELLGGAATAPTFSADSARTKDEILAALDQSFDYGLALLAEESGATVGLPVANPPSFLSPATHARVYWALMAHSMDIYGQMAVYLRLNGIVPPASAGA